MKKLVFFEEKQAAQFERGRKWKRLWQKRHASVEKWERGKRKPPGEIRSHRAATPFFVILSESVRSPRAHYERTDSDRMTNLEYENQYRIPQKYGSSAFVFSAMNFFRMS